jgi:hypothetical protein
MFSIRLKFDVAPRTRDPRSCAEFPIGDTDKIPGFSETAFCADTVLTAEPSGPGCAEAWTSPAGAENTPSDTGKNRDESSCNLSDGKTPLEVPAAAPTPFNKKPDGAAVVGADRTADTAATAANSLRLSTPSER